MDGPQLSRLFRALADVVQNADAEGIDNLVRDLKVYRTGNRAPNHQSRGPSRNPQKKKQDSQELLNIAETLAASSTRDEGHQLLESLKLNRADLATIAREKNVHITKQDNISDIEKKLVEDLIGARLNSQAIRGNSPSGTREPA